MVTSPSVVSALCWRTSLQDLVSLAMPAKQAAFPGLQVASSGCQLAAALSARREMKATRVLFTRPAYRVQLHIAPDRSRMTRSADARTAATGPSTPTSFPWLSKTGPPQKSRPSGAARTNPASLTSEIAERTAAMRSPLAPIATTDSSTAGSLSASAAPGSESPPSSRNTAMSRSTSPPRSVAEKAPCPGTTISTLSTGANRPSASGSAARCRLATARPFPMSTPDPVSSASPLVILPSWPRTPRSARARSCTTSSRIRSATARKGSGCSRPVTKQSSARSDFMGGETRAHHGSSWLKYSETVASGEDLDALIKRAQEGDVRAFEALLAGHLPRVRRFARAFSASDTDADDLAQEALLKVYRSLKLFRYQAAFSTWLYAVVRNVFLDGARSRSRRDRQREDPLEPEHGQVAGDTTAADERIGREQERRRLWRALRQVPEEFRSAMVLFDIEGRSYDEVAATL